MASEALLVDPIINATGEVRLPGSKSISNRVLLLSSLATGRTSLQGLLDADDTQVMRSALIQLGVPIVERIEQHKPACRSQNRAVPRE